jgi:hypothetical protein
MWNFWVRWPYQKVEKGEKIVFRARHWSADHSSAKNDWPIAVSICVHFWDDRWTVWIGDFEYLNVSLIVIHTN